MTGQRGIVRAGEGRRDRPVVPAEGLSVDLLLGPAQSSTHLEAAMCTLAPGGVVSGHLHPFEESFYVVEGAAVVTIGDVSYTLVEGDFGLVPHAYPHAWSNPSEEPFRWLRVRAPAPRGDGRTVRARPTDGVAPAATGRPVAIDSDAQRFVGHFDDDQLPPPGPLAMPGYHGYGIDDVSVRMMVDDLLGARHHTLFVVQFAPSHRFSAKEHFHPFDELYYFVAGEADGVVGGEPCRVRAGDLVYAGVNVTHGFTNAGDVPVRWIEAQAPMPPASAGTLFVDDWAPEESSR